MEEEEKVQELQEKQKGPKEVTEQFKQGNIREAVRELEKSKQRKRWRRRIIIAIIIFLSILLIAASFYSIIKSFYRIMDR